MNNVDHLQELKADLSRTCSKILSLEGRIHTLESLASVLITAIEDLEAQREFVPTQTHTQRYDSLARSFEQNYQRNFSDFLDRRRTLEIEFLATDPFDYSTSELYLDLLNDEFQYHLDLHHFLETRERIAPDPSEHL